MFWHHIRQRRELSPSMLQYLPALTARWRSGEIGHPAYATAYLVHWQVELHGKRFASRRCRNSPKADAETWIEQLAQLSGAALDQRLIDWVCKYQFVGIRPNVNAALQAWLEGQWPLHLVEYIPRPSEVLAMQSQGQRPVTVISAFPRLRQPVLSKPHAFAFMLHDLEHAWKFFNDVGLSEMQQRFFQAIGNCVEAGHFAQHTEDAVFSDKFEYLISDMNTHPEHSLQYLKAILIEYHLRQEQKDSTEQVSEPAWREIQKQLETLRAAI